MKPPDSEYYKITAWDDAGYGADIKEGMTLAIEPDGEYRRVGNKSDRNGWTVAYQRW